MKSGNLNSSMEARSTSSTLIKQTRTLVIFLVVAGYTLTLLAAASDTKQISLLEVVMGVFFGVAFIALGMFDKVNQARQFMAETSRLATPEFYGRPFLSDAPEIPALLSLVVHTKDLNQGTRSFVKGTLAMLGHADGTQET